MKGKCRIILAGLGAGAVNGLFGAGGGMVLVPLLTGSTELKKEEVFPASVSIILPVCLISLWLGNYPLSFSQALPYLMGSAAGGVAAGFLGKKIKVKWLHRILGLFVLWGGIRYLC